MARTFVNAGRRRQYTAGVVNKAGDLNYVNGFYGVQQDNSVVGELTMHILEGVWDLPNVFAAAAISIPAGAKVWAAPSAVATSLALYPAISIPSGAYPVGRVWSTYASGASYARVALFGPENQYLAATLVLS
jgi:predicted RecA/RadA family phage recombinase